jgi:hypothetical protein
MKELKVYKCEVHYGIMQLSYGIRFAKITAYSKAEAMRIAAANTDNFKRCKVKQVLPAAPDAVHGTFERLMG